MSALLIGVAIGLLIGARGLLPLTYRLGRLDGWLRGSAECRRWRSMWARGEIVALSCPAVWVRLTGGAS